MFAAIFVTLVLAAWRTVITFLGLKNALERAAGLFIYTAVKRQWWRVY